MTAEGMTSVSVSLETRRQLNQMRSMMEFKNIDLLLEHLLMEKRLSRLSAESKQLQEHLEKLDDIDVNDLIEKLELSFFLTYKTGPFLAIVKPDKPESRPDFISAAIVSVLKVESPAVLSVTVTPSMVTE